MPVSEEWIIERAKIHDEWVIEFTYPELDGESFHHGRKQSLTPNIKIEYTEDDLTFNEWYTESESGGYKLAKTDIF